MILRIVVSPAKAPINRYPDESRGRASGVRDMKLDSGFRRNDESEAKILSRLRGRVGWGHEA